jgi:hypothetical protein
MPWLGFLCCCPADAVDRALSTENCATRALAGKISPVFEASLFGTHLRQHSIARVVTSNLLVTRPRRRSAPKRHVGKDAASCGGPSPQQALKEIAARPAEVPDKLAVHRSAMAPIARWNKTAETPECAIEVISCVSEQRGR